MRRMRMSKLMGRILVPVLVAFLLAGFLPMTARAEETAETEAAETEAAETAAAEVAEPIQIQKLVITQNGTAAKEEPKANAKTMMTYEAGAQIAVVEEVNAAWYKVIYQGNIYYVKKADTADIDPGYAPEELNQQFEQEKLESKFLVEEIERQQAEAKQTRIWVAVIVVLVAAIFGVGVYSHLSAKKAEKENDENGVKDEE